MQPKCISDSSDRSAETDAAFSFCCVDCCCCSCISSTWSSSAPSPEGFVCLGASWRRGEISCVEPGIWRGISVCCADSRGAFDLLILLIVPDVQRGRANWEVTHLAILLFPGDVDHGFLVKSTGVIAQKQVWRKVERLILRLQGGALMWCLKPLTLSNTSQS